MRTSRALLVAAAVAATVGVAACGNSNSGTTNASTNTSATSAATPVTASSPVRIPAGFPLGSWTKMHGQYHPTLFFSNAALVKLQDSRGQSTEVLTFPAAHEVRFTDPQSDFCAASQSGTYRYTHSHHLLSFVLVGTDNCQDRVQFLTGHWTSAS